MRHIRHAKESWHMPRTVTSRTQMSDVTHKDDDTVIGRSGKTQSKWVTHGGGDDMVMRMSDKIQSKS